VDLAARASLGEVAAGGEHLVAVQHLTDPVQARHRPGEPGRLLRDVPQRPVQLGAVGDEDDEVAGGDGAACDAQDADAQDERGGDGAEHLDDAAEPSVQAGDLDADR
jgi:hypothetical protein